MDTFVRGQASFQATLTNIGGNDRDDMFLCSRKNGAKKGEHQFCEAVKVDVSKTKETNFQASITNTIALVEVLFEDVGVATELIEMAKKEKKRVKCHSQVGIRYYSIKLLNLRRVFLRISSTYIKRNV
jgi:hypothetical protein